MSVSAPSRRLVPQCLFCHSLPIRARRPPPQQRLISQSTPRKADGDDSGRSSNPVLEQYRRDNPEEPAGQGRQQQDMPKPGDLAASSIFEDDRRAQRQARRVDAEEDDELQVGGQTRDPNNMLPVLDPDPNARERWERKKVIQMIAKGGRLSKKEMIKRTEREHLVKSHMMKTSVKKLGMLARQISGKRIEDAITQMRFSKKKVAQDVLKQLEFARDEAVVMRGMGLGSVAPSEASLTTSGAPAPSTSSPTTPNSDCGKPLQIQLKSGARHAVTDKSTIYIDQAWVGRGPYGMLPDYRARGRVYVMRTPWTSLSVVLKEEGTRVRQWEEREAKLAKERKERVWRHLPDRPVVGAGMGRGWYAW